MREQVATLLQQAMAGIVVVLSLLTLRLYKGRPSSSEEWSELLYLAVVGFMDGFMVAQLVPFFPTFAAKFTFHLFFYLLLASISILFYLAYKGYYDFRVLAIALAPWYLALLLVLYSRIVGVNTIFIF
ncbi:hypothetical protein IG193_00285 [Infirmifilum lucidum]|uniref:Uncharacterized protein n=1 Tax=Infirmifilum lucidum TaxID=2776706 RepID=A0A7L9FGQ5_9CREN|nr:hypothetical protein [Infirmifilum lucidum]QOJ78939.1 hypothetical protein IG193_00285 [Infirmifilum lucidum]